MKRLMIIADQSTVVHAIRLALRRTPGFALVGFFDGRRSARAKLVELRPDVVLVDDMRDPGDTLARLRETSEARPEATALLLTLRMDGGWLAQAFEAGADGALSKTIHPVALGTVLREISCDRVIVRRTKPSEVDCPLTVREVEILKLAAQGHTNGQIARALWITEPTVKFHLSRTYRKLGVTNRTEASRYAYMNALSTPQERIAS